MSVAILLMLLKIALTDMIIMAAMATTVVMANFLIDWKMSRVY